MKRSNEFNHDQQAETRGKQGETLTRGLSLPDRLAEAARILERLDQERASLGDPTLGQIIEERIVSRELIDLELQNFDEEVERHWAIARDFLLQEITAAASELSLSTWKA